MESEKNFLLWLPAESRVFLSRCISVERLEAALQESGADYRYFVMEHSGHGLQNDNRVYAAYMKTVEANLEKYMG